MLPALTGGGGNPRTHPCSHGPRRSMCLCFPLLTKRALEGRWTVRESLLSEYLYPPRDFKLQQPHHLSVGRAGLSPDAFAVVRARGGWVWPLTGISHCTPAGVAQEGKIKHSPAPVLLNAISWRARKRSGGYFTSSLRNVYTAKFNG